MIEVWRGGVETWECDVNAHMNVRFYLAKAMEGLATGAAALGLPHAFKPGAGATLAPRDVHIRYFKESVAGDSLALSLGLVEMDETGAVLFLRMAHQEGEALAATFVMKVEHVTALGRPFPWPARARALGEAIRCELPEKARPRSLGPGPFRADLAGAQALGLAISGRGAVRPDQVDAFGRMQAEWVLGRVASAMPAVSEPLRQAAAEMPGGLAWMGGAAVEMRILYAEEQPRAGHLVQLNSGYAKVGPKAQTLVHWLVDPLSGRGWASVEMVRVNLDLEQRRAFTMDDGAVARLQALVCSGLA